MPPAHDALRGSATSGQAAYTATPMSNADRARVAVCVCTYRRPDQLDALLHRIRQVAAKAAEYAVVGVVVIDDDPDLSAASVVARHSDEFELGLEYRSTSSGNISTARNTALDVGTAMAEWLAMVDDDCMPDIGWVRELLQTSRLTGADCVSGRCFDVALPGAPAWLSSEPFLTGFDAPIDGCAIEIGALKNTLVSAAFLRSHRIRFDVAFGRAGGEDVMFFHACHVAGMFHVYSARAIVREPVPLKRSTLSWQLKRSLWYGNTGAVTSISSGRTSRIRMCGSGLKQIVVAGVSVSSALVGRRPLQWRYGLAVFLQGVGRTVGSVGVKLPHH